MGYFDSVKTRAPEGAVAIVPKSNVVKLRDDIHPYAAAIRSAWLDRLDRLDRPWVQGASWDTNCFVTARKLIELANSPWSGYDMGEAATDYLEHAPHDGVWDKREKCWSQALDRSGGNALTEPEPGAPLPAVTTLDEEVEAAAGPPLNPIIDWQVLFSADEDDEEWIVEPLLPARRMVALYSAPKAGKSLLMLEIAAGIARGVEVMGFTPERARRVLYVDFENDPKGDIRTRLEAMDIKPDQLDNLCYLTFPSLAKFDTAAGAVDLMRHVEGYACEVVVIDTVSRAVMGEENDNDTWLAFYRNTGLALKRAGVACIRLDHSGKDTEKGMRGGSAKSGDVDAVWRLTLLNETTINLECTDHRMPVAVTSLTLVRQTWPLAHVLATGVTWRAALDAKSARIDELLDTLGVSNSASTREAATALRTSGHKVENGPLREAVRFRKMRLDTPGIGVSGTPPAHPGTPGGSVPGTPPPLGGVRHTSSSAPGTPSEEADVLARCKGCDRPTTQAVFDANAGLCASCHRASGQVTP